MGTPQVQPAALMFNLQPATPSGRIELSSDWLARRWGDAARLPAYRPADLASEAPLALISPASSTRISSTLLGAGGCAGEAPPLLMHPSDAAARGLTSGSAVSVFNTLGEVVLPLLVTDAVPPGVVSSDKGAWCATSPTGQSISALCSADARADLADGACFNDTAVQVRAAQ
jgi:anaerobic selenocysteine-containing dehydrogenase